MADEGKWGSCTITPGLFTESPPVNTAPAGFTALSADRVESQEGGESLFSGNVTIQHDERTLQGERASYNQQSGEVAIEGEIRYFGEGVVMQGDRAGVDMPNQRGEFEGVSFFFRDSHAFGKADSLSLNGSELSTLKGVSYTTCPPGSNGWLLSAKELQLDQQNNTGEAYHTVLRFKGVPIFYSPYLNFPLSGRKSGLLPPTIGSSAQSGSDVSLPIYWNIAPNYDATLTPRHLSKRGTMAMSEFRYLSESSEGMIQADHLGDDKVYGGDRDYLALEHRTRFDNGWGLDIEGTKVSDPLYLSDLGGSEGSGATQLERRFDLHYNDHRWGFLARGQGYQTLSGTTPYQRLPQLRLSRRSTPAPNNLQLGVEAEAVSFGHEDPTQPTGERLDIKPTVSLPLQGAAWYLTPTAAWRYTQYQLESNLIQERHTRSLPLLSLDSGLFFDRETSFGGHPYTHTVEPRLFFLSVPYQDQDTLPLFDTAAAPMGFEQLFRDNRFNGVDRQGDTQQITGALTTRLLDDGSGVERLRASIGGQLYLDERQVQLNPATPPQIQRASNVFTEIELQPLDRLHIGVNGSYHRGRQRHEQVGAHLRYQPDSRRVLSLDYRYDETMPLRQGDAILYWPMAQQWQGLGRWRYDLDHEQSLEQLIGVEYQSCCWSIRLIGRNQRPAINSEVENSLYLTFEFKGLGSLGKRLEDTLEDGLPTYD
ncbi:MAG: LPS-assembly protein LptD [Chromatiales bacterium]|nr:LPS-assembly protein LptD [Chromatiales bacterium]